jgi:hypothetical protein
MYLLDLFFFSMEEGSIRSIDELAALSIVSGVSISSFSNNPILPLEQPEVLPDYPKFISKKVYLNICVRNLY